MEPSTTSNVVSFTDAATLLHVNEPCGACGHQGSVRLQESDWGEATHMMECGECKAGIYFTASTKGLKSTRDEASEMWELSAAYLEPCDRPMDA